MPFFYYYYHYDYIKKKTQEGLKIKEFLKNR